MNEYLYVLYRIATKYVYIHVYLLPSETQCFCVIPCYMCMYILGSSEAAGCTHVQPQRGDQGSQDTDEAEDGRGQGGIEEEAPGPGEGVGEGLSDVGGSAEPAGGSIPWNRAVQVYCVTNVRI